MNKVLSNFSVAKGSSNNLIVNEEKETKRNLVESLMEIENVSEHSDEFTEFSSSGNEATNFKKDSHSI